MGQIMQNCFSCKKDENKEGVEILKSDSSSESDENEIISYPTKLAIPPSPSDIILKTDNLVRSYSCSPYELYEELSTLGEGTFGLVKKVCLKNNKQTIRAMKIIPKQNIVNGQTDRLFEEIEILRKLEHPNIMKVYEYYIDPKNIYIISEFCDEGDLLGKMKKLQAMSELVVKFLMGQILDAIAYLHANRVFHGDIKLENIMLYKTSRKKMKRFTVINRDLYADNKLQNEIENNKEQNSSYVEDMSNYEVKLIDFGCSRYLKRKKNNVLSGIVGTSLYCSPEVVNDSYDEKSDEWSCGILMYILLSGDRPFEGETEEEIFDNIKQYNINFNRDEFKNISENCLDLMKRLLNPKKQNRITALEALRHRFFTEKLNPMKILTQHKDLSILKKFMKIEKYPTILHKVVIAYCCYNFISQEESKRLNELFRYLDQKNQNKLNLNDFKRGFKEANISVSSFQLQQIMDLLDTDGSKLIEYQEFLRALCDKDDLLKDENLKAVFNVIDKDKTGKINLSDIKDFIIGNEKNNLRETALKKFSEQIGMTKDSYINFEQFCDIIRNTEPEDNNIIRSNKTFYTNHDNTITTKNLVLNSDDKRKEMRRKTFDI